jgi:hypothetical protein
MVTRSDETDCQQPRVAYGVMAPLRRSPNKSRLCRGHLIPVPGAASAVSRSLRLSAGRVTFSG